LATTHFGDPSTTLFCCTMKKSLLVYEATNKNRVRNGIIIALMYTFKV
jgi:hypothetical protein